MTKKSGTGVVLVAMAVFLFLTSCQSKWLEVFDYWDEDFSAHDIAPFWGGFLVVGDYRVTDSAPNGKDAWLMKVDGDGKWEWAKAYGWMNSRDNLKSIVVTEISTGEAVLAGSSGSPYGHGGHDGWIVWVDGAGDVQQMEFFGGTGNDVFHHIIEADDGGLVAVGDTDSFGTLDAYVVRLDSSMNTVWQKRYGGPGLEMGLHVEEIKDTEEPDGIAYLVSATTDSFGAGDKDLWVLVLRSDGTVKWQRTYGGAGFDRGTRAIQVLDFEGSPDGFILSGVASPPSVDSGLPMDNAVALRLEEDGGVDWAYVYGSDYAEGEIYSVTRGIPDGYVFSGWTGPPDGDGWLLAIDDGGGVLWSRAYGGWNDHDSFFSPNALKRTLFQPGFVVAGLSKSWSSSGNWKPLIMSVGPEGNIPGCSAIMNRPANRVDLNFVVEEHQFSEDLIDSGPIVYKEPAEPWAPKRLKICPLDCIYRVNHESTDPFPDGETWGTAFQSIKDGIAEASAESVISPTGYCEVWTAEGAYHAYETSSADTIAMAEYVRIYGGFDGASDFFSDRDWEAHETILTGVEDLGSGRVFHVLTGADDSLLDGFFIEKGLANGPLSVDERVGGGMFNVDVSPAVRWCEFRDNFATLAGGGMFVSGGAPLVQNCRFEENGYIDLIAPEYTEIGGGVAALASSIDLSDCTFEGNDASLFGGGLYIFVEDDSVSPPMVLGSEFMGNEARAGSAVVNYNGPLTASTPWVAPFMANVLMYNNTSTGYEYGSLVYDGTVLNVGANAHPTMVHCTMADNEGALVTGGMYVSESDPVVWNSIFWGNLDPWQTDEIYYDASSSPWVGYSDIQDGWTGAGTGNIDINPVFSPLSYQLDIGSPCIDTAYDLPGTYPWILPYVNHDIDGDPRPVGSGYDMGCYEAP